MNAEDYKYALETTSSRQNQRILDRFFHAGVASCFKDSPTGEATLKHNVRTTLSKMLANQAKHSVRLHPLQLVICGSAYLGFSPVEHKLGKPFRPGESDIDIAIVNSELFDAWWTELAEANNFGPETNEAMVFENLFYGYIDPSTVFDCSDIGAAWWECFGRMSEKHSRSKVRGRLYKSYWAMQNYHVRTIDAAVENINNRLDEKCERYTVSHRPNCGQNATSRVWI